MSRLEQFRDSGTGWPAGWAERVPLLHVAPRIAGPGLPARGAIQFFGQPAC